MFLGMHLVKYANSRIVSLKHTGMLKLLSGKSQNQVEERKRERRGLLNMDYYG